MGAGTPWGGRRIANPLVWSSKLHAPSKNWRSHMTPFEKIKHIFIIQSRLLKIADKIIIDKDFSENNIAQYKVLRRHLNEFKSGDEKSFDMD